MAMRHGHNKYKRDGCRCGVCTADNTRVRRESRHRRIARARANPELIKEHGTTIAYREDGCRCDLCREAARLESLDLRARKRGWPRPGVDY